MTTDGHRHTSAGIPRAVAFDLDGTLTESKSSMAPEMGLALSVLIERLPVGILSGGWFPQFEKQCLPFFPSDTRFENLFLFPSSASCCYVYANGVWKAYYDNAFSADERERVMHALDEALAETGLATPPPRVWGERIEDRGSQITFSGLGQKAPVAEKKKWDPDMKKRMPLRDALLKRLTGFSIAVNAYSSVDITREGMTKAYGVRRFSEILGIPIENMLYVGDALFEGGNDAVVTETGIPTHAVTGPADALFLIQELTRKLSGRA